MPPAVCSAVAVEAGANTRSWPNDAHDDIDPLTSPAMSSLPRPDRSRTKDRGQSMSLSRRQPRAGPAVRCRAAKACRRCNEKRVKCDASVRGTPCTRCEKRQEPDCTMIQSRRGIYVRKTRAATEAEADADADADGHKSPQIATRPRDTIIAASGPTTAVVPPAEQTQRQRQSEGTEPTQASLVVEPRGHQHRHQNQPPVRFDIGHDADRDTFVQQTHTISSDESTSSPLNQHDTPSGQTDSSTALSSYRDASWATLFEHLIETQQADADGLDKYSITYLGESFPLSIVMRDLRGGNGRHKLHHAHPQYASPFKSSEPQTSPHPPYMRAEEITYLVAKKAFEAPDASSLDAFVAVFLDRVYPLYPIVNLHEFRQQFQARRIPWILLHAVCFLAATFCQPRIIHRAGFESRRQARWTFYSKAKALFDMGYESNKVVVLQVCIMLSFWGGGPNMYGNFYSWISTGVTMAEALGCHRSMVGLNIKPQDRSLLKRLWWVLVIRDTACASLIGLPFKINLDHCDIDPLVSGDFAPTDTASHSTPSQDSPRSEPSAHADMMLSGMYQIQATKLSLILRRLINARFSPTKASPMLHGSYWTKILMDWRAQLPPQLTWSDDAPPTHPRSIFASCLCIMYNHHMILAHINGSTKELPLQTRPIGGYIEQASAEETSIVAAQQIAATACAVVVKSDILLAPHELLHGIFVAAVVFYIQTKSTNMTTSQLGMAGLTNCKMVLHDSRETWDPSPWVTQLLDKLLSAHQAATRRAATTDNDGGGGGIPDSGLGDLNSQAYDAQVIMENVADAYDGNGMFPAGYDMWQSHPVLGNLFGMSLDPALMPPMTPSFHDQTGTTPWF